jgi:hypothetical protein
VITVSDFELKSTAELTAQMEEARQHLRSPDAGTGLTHINDAEVLQKKAKIALILNRIAFTLKFRDDIQPEVFDAVTDECRPYLVRANAPSMEPIRT